MESNTVEDKKYLSDTCVFESNAYESTLPSEDSKIQGVLRMVTGPVAEYGTKNRNGRVYSEKLWDDVLDNSYVKEQIKYNTLFGEANHPESRFEVDFGRVSHMIKKMWKVPASNQIYATIYILDTPLGKILDTLYKAGSIIGYSSRAGGTLTQRKGYIEVDEKSYNFITFDAVPFPSVASARPDEISEGVVQEKKQLSDNTHKELCKIIKESSTISRSVIKDFIYSLKGYDVAPEKEILEGKDMTVGGADDMSEPCKDTQTVESSNEETKVKEDSNKTIEAKENESKTECDENKKQEVEEKKDVQKEEQQDESCNKGTEKKTVEAVENEEEDESCKNKSKNKAVESADEKESDAEEVEEKKACDEKKTVQADECNTKKPVEESSTDKNMNVKGKSIDETTLSMLKESSLQIENLKMDNQTLKAVKESLERSNRGLSNSLDRALDRVANLIAEKDRMGDDLNRRVQESVIESSSQANNTIRSLKEEVQRLRNEIIDKDLELENLSSVREAAKSLEYQNSCLKFNESRRDDESTRLHESNVKLDELRQQVKEAYAEISRMVSEGNDKDSKIKSLEERVDVLYRQKDKMNESVQEAKSLRDRNSELEDEVSSLHDKVNALSSKESKIQESADRKLSHLQERYSDMQSEMDSLNESLEEEKDRSSRYKEDLISVISNGYGLTMESVKSQLPNNFSKSDVYCVCEKMAEGRKGTPVIVGESRVHRTVAENENESYAPTRARDLFGASRRGARM